MPSIAMRHRSPWRVAPNLSDRTETRLATYGPGGFGDPHSDRFVVDLFSQSYFPLNVRPTSGAGQIAPPVRPLNYPCGGRGAFSMRFRAQFSVHDVAVCPSRFQNSGVL